VFSQFSTAELEAAPLRARLRWADAIDEALDAAAPSGSEPALQRLRDVLRDADVPVSRDDLRRLRAVLQATPEDADAARRGAHDLAGSLADGATADGRRCVSG
jgi:hypothetical protein